MVQFILALAVSVTALSNIPAALAAEAVFADDKASDCVTNANGKEVCGIESKPGTLPTPAKVAIALVVVVVIFLLLATVLFIRRSRKESAEAAKDVTIEASQMAGPATILAATYTPGTGHSRVYSIGPDTGGFSAVPVTPQHRAAPNTAVVPPTAESDHAGGLRRDYDNDDEDSPVRPQTPAFPSPSLLQRSSSFCRFPITPTGEAPRSAPAHKASFSDSSSGYPFNGYGNRDSMGSQNRGGDYSHSRGPSTGSSPGTGTTAAAIGVRIERKLPSATACRTLERQD